MMCRKVPLPYSMPPDPRHFFLRVLAMPPTARQALEEGHRAAHLMGAANGEIEDTLAHGRERIRRYYQCTYPFPAHAE